MSRFTNSLWGSTLIRVAPIALAALGLALWVTNSLAQRQLRRSVEDRLHSAVTTTALELGRDFQRLQEAAEFLAENALIVNAVIDSNQRRTSVVPFFRNLRLPGSEFRQAALLDYRGRPLVSSNDSAIPELGSLLDEVMGGRSCFLFEPDRLICASPVLYADRPEGVIVIEYDPAALLQHRQSVGEGGRLQLWKDGALIAEAAHLDEAPEGNRLQESLPIPGHEGVMLRESIAESVAFRSLEHLAFALTSVMLGAAVFVLISIFFTARMATKPLSALVHEVQKIETAGDLQGSIDISGPSEFQNLITSFNSMMSELSKTTVSLDELRKSDARLQKAVRELASSNKDLRQFAYAASHDLQEPLRKITSFSQLLSEEIGDELSGDGRIFLNYVLDGSKRMRQLVKDLLAYSSLSGEMKIESVDLNSSVREALDNLQLMVDEAGAVVTCDPLPTVRGEKAPMTLLVQNLLSNGIKYCEGTPEVHVGTVEDPDNWTLFVRDNGIGIEETYFEQIFGVFKRLHGKESYSGTGIGLAICHRIVERLSGEIRVESRVGEGTTIWVSIPKVAPKEPDVDTTAALPNLDSPALKSLTP